MKVFITGGAGFIGSTLTDRLVERGDEVLIIDNFLTGRRENLPKSGKVRLVEGTILDEPLMEKLFDEFKPDQVVHTAASYSDPNNWKRDIETNALGSAIVAGLTKKKGASKLIYFQTSLCYGPIPREQPITLNHPLWPNTSYAISKTSGEQYIAMSGMDFISFRLANMYGPRNLSGPLPTFYKRLTGGQPCVIMDARRDFMYIHDLIQVVLMALDGKGGSGYYHVSTGKDFSIKELFDEAVKCIGIKLDKPAEMRARGADDVATLLLDPSRTKKDFGWESKTPMAEGIKTAVEWYKVNGVSHTVTHLNIEGQKRI